jgi:hypothetical protein
MKNFLKCYLTAAAIATAVLGSSAPGFARGGAANIMNSPGYQRRLQESRQQVSQPQVPSSAHRGHKPRHHHRH